MNRRERDKKEKERGPPLCRPGCALFLYLTGFDRGLAARGRYHETRHVLPTVDKWRWLGVVKARVGKKEARFEKSRLSSSLGMERLGWAERALVGVP